jgi:hypothetical protein
MRADIATRAESNGTPGACCSSVVRVVTSAADSVLLVGAGALAGAVGSAGGITSLISYPALLAVGIRPLPANVTNAVALVGSFAGSALGSRPELRGRGRWLARWALLTVVGAAAGVALLLLTPDRLFGRIVPFFLVFAAIALVLQPRISRWREVHLKQGGRFLFPCGLFAVSVYSGYFGAGSGIIVLALLLVTVEQHLAKANALKNMLLGVADLAAAIGFAAFGPVHWTAAAPLAVGLFAGSMVGPSVTRRVPGPALRLVVASAGIGLAIWLWVSPR